jgi:hypothetical protein
MTRCACTTPMPGAFAVCRTCGGECQKQHSRLCDCAVCEQKKPLAARMAEVRAEIARGGA